MATGTAAGIWLSLVSTTATVLGKVRPEITLNLGGSSADALATLATRKIVPDTPAFDLAGARALATQALRREAVNLPAIRTLGLIAALQSDEASAHRIFQYGEAVSRRDLATQLWLIEASVAKNDIDAALKHYDRALRASLAGRETLLPVLAKATAAPEVAEPLSRILVARPPWWTGFAYRLVEDGPSPQGIALIFARLQLDAGKPEERLLLTAAIQRLVNLGAFEEAFQLYRAARPQHAGGLLRDGAFQQSSELPPIDWDLTDQDGLAAVQQTGDGNGTRVLQIIAGQGRSGTVARQLLMLTTGRYRLSGQQGVGDTPLAGAVRIVCAASGGTKLAQIPIGQRDRSAFSGEFQVPDGCSAQWLTVDVQSDMGQGPSEAWIDTLTLSRL